MSETLPHNNMDAVPRKNSKSEGRKISAFEKPLDLDYVLVNELGQFGRFQVMNLLLVAVPIIMSAFMSEYIFSAAAIPHRCRIPECGENEPLTDFEPKWISNAIPAVAGSKPLRYSSCERFASVNLEANVTVDVCSRDLFDTSTRVKCEEYVYAKDNSVVYDFNLGCQEWLRALAGTLSNVGTLLVLPVTGYVSDRYGRRVTLVISTFNLGLIGLLKAFSVNYPMYLALQLLQTTLGAGAFSSAYIFAAELVGPKYRVIAGAILGSMFALGQIILGSVAWMIQPWRYMIMALYIPCFLIISYYWILSESVRWLLSKQKYTEAKAVLEKVARVNGTTISEKSLLALTTAPPATKDAVKEQSSGLISSIVDSPVLLRRVCTTPVWWITATFVYYGLSINSTGLSDTMYLNYILTCAIEVPGLLTAVLVLDRIGRKATLTFGYFFSAACNIAFVFISKDLTILRMIIYLFGKFGIAMVMKSLYLFTSELYPTEYRHSLLAFSSMIGRIGSISAPLTPVLAQYWHGIPSMMFGIMGIIAGILTLTQPETLGTKMPDTLAEAEALGRHQN